MIIRRHIEEVARRRMPRLEMRLDAGVAVVGRTLGRSAGKPKLECVIRDISEEGMGLVSDSRIPERKVVKLRVALPEHGGKTMGLNGRVRWAYMDPGTGRFFAGIQLDALPRHSKAVWARAIRERIREHFSNPVNQLSPVVL